MGKREKLTIVIPVLAAMAGVGLGMFLAHEKAGTEPVEDITQADNALHPVQEPGEDLQLDAKAPMNQIKLMSKYSKAWSWTAVICAPFAAVIWGISLLSSPDFVIFPRWGWTASLVVAGFSALFAVIGISQSLPAGSEEERKSQNVVLSVSLVVALIIFCAFSFRRSCKGADVFGEYEWFFTCAAFICIFVQFFITYFFKLRLYYKMKNKSVE